MIYPLESLYKQKTEVTGFFYNPNICPLPEYQKRRQAIVDLSTENKCEVIYSEYLPSEFMQAVELNKEQPVRCLICWRLRLEKTAQAAKDKGFDSFSTTLLVSPYQDQEALKKIGEDIAEQAGVYFHYEDFRPGFRKAHNLAKEKGIYCQNYCGCMYSYMERCEKK
jgi:hypothetical protein